MRLPLQITIGQAFVVALPIGLSVLGISLLVEMARTIDRISLENHQAIQAAHGLNRAMLLYEIGRTEGVESVLGKQKQDFATSLEALRRLVRSDDEYALLERIEQEAADFFAGERHLRDMLAVVSSVVDLQEDAIVDGSTRCREVGKSGVGLVALLGALSLVAALYFGYWLTRHLGYPFERMLRGLDEIVGGDLRRRISEPPAIPVLDRMTRSINLLADRLQRSESESKLEFLVAAAAAEHLLDATGSAAIVVMPSDRLVLSNGLARDLVDGAEGAQRRWGAPDVQRVALTDSAGRAIGAILSLPRAPRG